MTIKERISRSKLKIKRVYISLQSNKTPWYAKALGWITLAYALSPIDLIPDFVPVLGYLDDLIILPVLIFITIKLIPKQVWDDSLLDSKNLWKNSKPEKWYFAIPIAIIWIMIIYIIIKSFV